MADLADVETALVILISVALYPDGPAFPSTTGTDCRVYRGWPMPAALDADLKAGKVNVTVFPDAAPGQTLTHYSSEWRGLPATPTLSGIVIGNTVTFSGAATLGQVAGICFANSTFAYRTVDGDTPTSVSANLAALIRSQRIVRLVGPTLTIPGAANIIARVVADGPALREIRRQSHDIRLSLWCPTPALRDTASAIIDTALAGRIFIDLPDHSTGRLAYKNTAVFDQSQSAMLYRRDLIYSVEYATIASESLPAMLFGELALGAIDVSV